MVIMWSVLFSKILRDNEGPDCTGWSSPLLSTMMIKGRVCHFAALIDEAVYLSLL